MKTPDENKAITEPSEQKIKVQEAGYRIMASGNPATDRVWGKAGVTGLWKLRQLYIKINMAPREVAAPVETEDEKPKKKKGKSKKSTPDEE